MTIKLQQNNLKHHLTSVRYKNINYLQNKKKITKFTSNSSKYFSKLENQHKIVMLAPKSSLLTNKTHKLIK